MKKEQYDELYHLLRVASNSTPSGAFYNQEVVYGLAKHLLAGGDYLSLIKFSSQYGKRFLLRPACDVVMVSDLHPSRIVEFGGGTSWLSRGLGVKLGLVPTLSVDKRPWSMINIVADLETEVGRAKVLSQMKTGDLIVMSELLHCLDDPQVVLDYFCNWPMLIIEYMPSNEQYAESYREQTERFGCNLISQAHLEQDLLYGKEFTIKRVEPHVIVLVKGK